MEIGKSVKYPVMDSVNIKIFTPVSVSRYDSVSHSVSHSVNVLVKILVNNSVWDSVWDSSNSLIINKIVWK